MKTGDFPEDKIGNAMMSWIKQAGMSKIHRVFGCFLLDDDSTIYVRHVHGRHLGESEKRTLDKYVSFEETEK